MKFAKSFNPYICIVALGLLSCLDAKTGSLISIDAEESTTEKPWTPTELGTVSYIGRDEAGYTVLYVQFQAVLNITYDLKRETSEASADEDTTDTTAVNIPSTDNCTHKTTTERCTDLKLSCSWIADPTLSDEYWTFEVTYSVDSPAEDQDYCKTDSQDKWDSFDYSITGFALHFYFGENYFPRAKYEGESHSISNQSLAYFKTDGGSSYKCDSETTETVTPEFRINFSNYQSQAFQISSEKDTAEFDTAITCDLDDDGSTLVPIIVGCVLAALIILTLIAYFIGRWHQNRQGAYQQL